MSLEVYLKAFRSLRSAQVGGRARPHKLCMMMAVIDGVESGRIVCNRIFFDDELKIRFSHYFELFRLDNDKNDPCQPFFYLQGDGFWHHKAKAGHEAEYQERIKARQHGSPGVVNRIIDYVYLDQDLFDYLRSDITRDLLLDALRDNIDDYSKRFQHWALGIGKSEKTIKNYLGALKGSLSQWADEANPQGSDLLSIHNYAQFQTVAQEVRETPIFLERNSKGKGMYNAALKLYGDFLADVSGQQVSEDIDSIYSDSKLDSTEKAVLVNTRIGQGKFREKLIDYWQGCALTGYRDSRFLVASHIKPWRDADNSERLSVFNGVLLLPNLDKAFDLGYISFSDKGRVMISEQLESPHALGVTQGMSLVLTNKHQSFMDYHRQMVFKN